MESSTHPAQADGGPHTGATAVSVDEISDGGNHGVRQLPARSSGVTLWWCDLAWDATQLAIGEALLAPAETARADRFSQPALRARYVAGRASLRRVLGQLLALHPARVPIVHGERGRPHVAVKGAPDFNVSNTRQCALIGVASAGRIGVDLEHRDRQTPALKVARKFLGASERAALEAYPQALQRERFLRWWTCKEAMSKATGAGISAPFARMTVAIAPQPALTAGPDPYLPQRWMLWEAAVPEGYLGSVAQWAPPTAP